ncbi:YchJ family protein [Rheinheimera sp.]|uniref:YchJ family protein n=1 Tax=Rheinheimera sp. TaxID=1869214 RepID=UPI003D2CBEC9
MSCYCGRPEDYQQCCGPLHQGLQQAKTPEQLMRSRFSAYVLKLVPYIANTYHQSKQSDNATLEISAFAEAATFLSLQVIATAGPEGFSDVKAKQVIAADSADTATGYVHFIARFLVKEQLHQLEEQSRFVQEQTLWRYLDGVLLPHAMVKTGRNDSCPCGSGKKFKACHSHWLNGQPGSEISSGLMA